MSNHRALIQKLHGIAKKAARQSVTIEEGLSALNGAAGFLRKLLSSSIALRTTPALNFFYDETGQRSQHLDALIDLAIASDSGNQEES